jgi:hypothetical protein
MSTTHGKYPTPSQIAECAGPCLEGGRDACDCGLREYGLPPLWQVMDTAYDESVPPAGKEWQLSHGYAAEIRALVEARLPEEPRINLMDIDMRDLRQVSRWIQRDERQRLRLLLLADAEEAEKET